MGTVSGKFFILLTSIKDKQVNSNPEVEAQKSQVVEASKAEPTNQGDQKEVKESGNDN